MKKLICALMCAVMLLGLTPSVFALKNGDVVDAVLHTDIVTYINGTPIESYNIKGYTAVKVEDLMNYGFMVVWDAGARTLKVTRPVVRPVTSTYVPVANTYIVGSYWMDVYYTDIKTYFNGNEVPSYNIGGSTIAYVDDLAKYFTTPDKYIWDGSARTLSLTLPGETSGSGSGSSTAQPTPTPTTTPAAPLKITSQPVSVTAKANDTVKFSVAVSGGEGTITYKWERRAPTETTWTAAGGTGADYSFTATQDVLSKNYIYRCVITDSKGNSVTSAEASLTAVVIAPLSIVIHPQSQTADTLLGTLSFTVAAQGGTPGAGGYLYLWQTSKDGVNWSPASGVSNGQIYNLAQSPDIISSVTYIRCVVTDSTGASVASNPAVVTGIGASAQPTEPVKAEISSNVVGVSSGNSATITCKASGGSGGYTYIWQTREEGALLWGIPISGNGGASFTLSNIKKKTEFKCTVTDSSGNKAESNVWTIDIVSIADIGGLTPITLPLSVKVSHTVSGTFKQNVTWKAEASGGKKPYTYQWQHKVTFFGATTWSNIDGETSDTYTLSLTSDQSGTWTRRCVVTDADGKTVTSNESVYTMEAKPLSVTVYGPSTATAGHWCTFKAVVSGGAGDYTIKWYVASASSSSWGSPKGTGESLMYAFSGSGTWEILCDVYDENDNNVYTSVKIVVS